MKVVLLKDVPNVGKRLEVKNVSSGHAQNFLIPEGLAETATAGALRRVEKERTVIEAERKIQADLLLKNAKSFDGLSIKIFGKASDKGHLFAGIHKEEISATLKKETHLDVPPEFIDLPHPIKEVGEHEVSVKVRDKVFKAKVVVEAEPEKN